MKRPHYAWIICLGGALVLLATMGLGANVFTIYQPEIIRLNGFTNAQGSWITTTRSLFILGTLLTVNQMCARLGLRLVMTLGTVLVGLSCLCFSFANSFPMYCCAAALTGIGYCYGGMVPLSLVIGHWFRDRKSLALGLASAGSGVSTIIAPTIVTWVMERYGMGAAFFGEGIFILLIGVLVWFMIRNAPADLGMEPYHLGGAEAPLPPPRPQPAAMTRGQKLALLFAAFLIGGPGGPGFSHLTVLYTSEGYDSMLVAALMSYLGLVLCVGKIVCGQVYDRLGGRRGNYYIFGMFLLGLVLCCLTPLGGSLLPFVSITIFGMGLPVSVVSFTLWSNDFYGDGECEGALRSLVVAYTIGMLLTGPLPGVLADRFGSYVPAYILFALCLLLSMAIVQPLYYKQRTGEAPKAKV